MTRSKKSNSSSEMYQEQIINMTHDKTKRVRSSQSGLSSTSNYSSQDDGVGLGILNMSRWSNSTINTIYDIESHSEVGDTDDEAEYYSHSDHGSPTWDCIHAKGLGIIEYPETQEEQLERWTRYYNNRHLTRCLNTGDDELLQDLMYERLLEEIQSNIPGADPLGPEYRGEWKVRAFWDDVRSELVESEEDDDDPSQQEANSMRKFQPIRDVNISPKTSNRATDGKDPELIEIRKYFMKKFNVENKKKLKPAFTF